MTISKNIRWGIIGCGAVTEIKSGPAYQNTDGFELVAVMRRDQVKAADFAKRHNIPKYYTEADELIADEDVDAVYIATPPDSHLYYALKVAKAGKPCCIEKPMAPKYQESLQIYNAFEEKKIPLFMAYYRRSLPRFNKIKQWLDEGAIGEVRHIHWNFAKPASELDKSGQYNWRTDARIAPGGYFDDLASHGLDLFIYLLGDIKNASGFATNQMGFYSAKDTIVGSWLHASEVTGVGSWNFGCHQREDRVVILGSLGKITFAIFKEEPIVLTNAKGEEKLEIPNPKHIQEFHVRNIKSHLAEEKPHPSLGRSGLHTSWVMSEILGSQ
ncbi:MAG: Gfo/Idh/MocA family oxidoreductase [Maribacter sp.]|nr:Gfo/Idh/MocA family oxidoreductase [Maribacter sp.]